MVEEEVLSAIGEDEAELKTWRSGWTTSHVGSRAMMVSFEARACPSQKPCGRYWKGLGGRGLRQPFFDTAWY